MSIGNLDDWQKWDDKGCERLAIACVTYNLRIYGALYYHCKKSKHMPSVFAKYEYRRQAVERFLTKGFPATVIDTEMLIKEVEKQIDEKPNRFRYPKKWEYGEDIADANKK